MSTPSSSGQYLRPRAHRLDRIFALVGWGVALFFLVTLLLSHSTMAPEIPRLQIKLPTFRTHRPEHPVTIVSGYYAIEGGKKHSLYEYRQWLHNFLDHLELPCVFYTSPDLVELIQELRGDKKITIISEWNSPFEMEPVVALGGRPWAEAHNNIDPERGIHVPDVYGIWTAKPWIVKHAKDMNPYDSEYFFWVDAGAFRLKGDAHPFKKLPEIAQKLFSTLPDDTLVLATSLLPFDDSTGFVTSATRGAWMDIGEHIQGGWYGGKAAAIDWWEEETMKVTILQGVMQRFSAKEQSTWTQAARLNWEKIYVQNMSLRKGDCGPDLWFSFQWFADGADCHIPVWNGPEHARLLLST